MFAGLICLFVMLVVGGLLQLSGIGYAGMPPSGGGVRSAWWHAALTALAPYGFLREKTGSVVAPAALHGASDVLVLAV